MSSLLYGSLSREVTVCPTDERETCELRGDPPSAVMRPAPAPAATAESRSH